MIHGFLNIDKPAGMTSHDVVAKLRRLVGQKRIGHAGTLDPAATGVLVIGLGQATRLIEYVQDDTPKRYLATVRLGHTTTTDDEEGETLTDQEVPALSAEQIEAALAQFRGEILQVPPMYSALHHEGTRLHTLARQGVVLDLPARPVNIYELACRAWDSPDITVDVQCSKGTYIRSLARDIGVALGCGAYLASLRRTAVGAFDLASATPLTTLLTGDVSVAQVLLPPQVALHDWPMVLLNDATLQRVQHGLPIAAAASQDEQRAYAQTSDSVLVALLKRTGTEWQPVKVFSGS